MLVAGIPMEALQGSRTCVFVGSFVKGMSPEFSEEYRVSRRAQTTSKSP